MTWKREGAGHYTYTDGKIDAFVKQEGEFWINAVYYDGKISDCGEWDGREMAFRNARRAIRNCVRLRSPLDLMERLEAEEDAENDCDD